MIGQLVYDFLASLSPSGVLNCVLYVIGGATLFGALIRIVPRWRGWSLINALPVLLTTIGIFGTFIGIAIGLVNFDTSAGQIDGSIPSLLEGLKTAFITSIVGMLASILLKIEYSLLPERSVEAGNVGPGDILRSLENHNESLVEIRKTLEAHRELVLQTRQQLTAPDDPPISQGLTNIQQAVIDGNSRFEEMRRAIAGEGDSSVVSQLIKIRTDIQDGFKDTRRAINGDDPYSLAGRIGTLHSHLETMGERVAQEFQEFARQVSEIGSKQLVEALKGVIEDFNKNLTEQFGENFKRLDESVKKLVDWQDAYREQMEQMDAQFKRSLEGIQHSEVALEKISAHTSAIPEQMDKLGTVITDSRTQLDDLGDHLQAFADIRDKAQNAMPEIKVHLDQTMETVKNAVVEASERYKTLIEHSDRLIADYNVAHQNVQQRLVEGSEFISRQLDEGGQRFVSTLGTGVQKLDEQLQTSGERLRQGTQQIGTTLEKGITEIGNQLERHTIGISEQLGKSTEQLVEGTQTIATQLDGGVRQLNMQMQNTGDTLAQETKKMAGQLSETANKLVQDGHAIEKAFTEGVGKIEGQLVDTAGVLLKQTEAMALRLNQGTEQINTTLDQGIIKLGNQLTERTGAIDAQLQQSTEQVVRGTQQIGAQLNEGVQEMQERLQSTLKTLDQGSEKISAQLGQASEKILQGGRSLEEQFRQGLERIGNLVDHTAKTLTGQAETMASRLSQGTEKIDTQLQESAKQLLNSAKGFAGDLNREMEALVKQVAQKTENQVSVAFNEQSQRMKELFTALQKHITQATNDHNQLIEKQIKDLDANMEQELGRALQHLAKGVGQISNHFVDDYKQITGQFRKLNGAAAVSA